jgi:AraC-like DNA-binding protein
MSEVWRAHDVPSAVQRDYMRHAIANTIVPFDLRAAEPSDVPSEIRSVDVGMVRVVYTASAECEVVRTPQLIRRSDPELCKIDVQLDGRTVFEQDDRQIDLGPGDFAFADLSRPCRLAGSFRSLAVVMFPRAFLPQGFKETREFAGIGFRRREPGSALVSALVRQMVRDLDVYDGSEDARIGTAVLDLITATLASRLDREAAVPRQTQQRALLLRIRAFIEERLGDPGLTPGAIAAAHYISVRYLHKLFEPQGVSVASWIRHRRLERCRRDLSDPVLNTRPVSAIATRWGLTEPAHFSRAFRAAYGVPPAEYRRLCIDDTSGALRDVEGQPAFPLAPVGRARPGRNE